MSKRAIDCHGAAWGLLAFWILTGTAHGFVPYINPQGQPLRWNVNSHSYDPEVVNPVTKAIRYHLAVDAFSPTNREAELNAVRAAFAQWQAAPGTALRFEEAGLEPHRDDIVSDDNTNSVFWARTKRVVGGVDLTNRRGYTAVALDADNNILETDTVFNGLDFGWFTDINDTRTARQFVEAIALHEIGHFIGLDHSPVGGATMAIPGNGLSTAIGLSQDEIAAAQFLYPAAGVQQGIGAVAGRVTAAGQGVFGAAVFAETPQGNIAAGTISAADGSYALEALRPGVYVVRACPLDPSAASEQNSLFRGRDVADDYTSASGNFLPSADVSVTVASNARVSLNLAVVSGSPPLRIAGLSNPNTIPGAETQDRTAARVELGRQNFYIGIVSASLTADTTLAISGDGVTVGPAQFTANRFPGGRHVLAAFASVSTSATPGLRSLIARHGAEIAYANGYLEILPLVPDDNFDGLDDRFQRRYFPLWTAPAAGPQADPDADGFSNRFEAKTGSDPTDPKSVSFLIRSVQMSAEGTRVVWKSDPGRRYQLSARPEFSIGAAWKNVGPIVTAQGDVDEFFDHTSNGTSQFYRLQLLPR